MQIVNIHEAKTHFSQLLDKVLHGQEVVIAKAGKPIAKLSALPQKPVRKFGLMKGKIRIAKDFDTSLPDNILDTFEGKA